MWKINKLNDGLMVEIQYDVVITESKCFSLQDKKCHVVVTYISGVITFWDPLRVHTGSTMAGDILSHLIFNDPDAWSTMMQIYPHIMSSVAHLTQLFCIKRCSYCIALIWWNVFNIVCTHFKGSGFIAGETNRRHGIRVLTGILSEAAWAI